MTVTLRETESGAQVAACPFCSKGIHRAPGRGKRLGRVVEKCRHVAAVAAETVEFVAMPTEAFYMDPAGKGHRVQIVDTNRNMTLISYFSGKRGRVRSWVWHKELRAIPAEVDGHVIFGATHWTPIPATPIRADASTGRDTTDGR